MGIDEIKEKIKESNPKNPADLKKILEDQIKKMQISEQIKKMQPIRGHIIDCSIALEEVSAQYILLTPNPSMAKSTFSKKIGTLKRIIQRNNQDKSLINKDFFKKLDRLVMIRNLFGHVPLNYFSKELRFQEEGVYSQWKKDIKNKSVDELAKEFIDTIKEVTEKISIYFLSITNQQVEDKFQ